MRKLKFLSMLVLIIGISVVMTGCSKGKDTVFSESTIKENKFNIKGEEYIKTTGIGDNQVFQSFYHEKGYVYGVLRTLVDKNNNVIEKDIEKNKNLSSNYLRIMEDKIYKMDSRGKISETERKILSSGEAEKFSLDELNMVVREGNLRYLDNKGIMGGFGYNDKGEVGILELGKVGGETLYKFKGKYGEKIKEGRYPHTEFIDLEERYLVSTFYKNKTEGNIEKDIITDIVIVDRDENKEYVLYEDDNLDSNKYLDDFIWKKKIAYNKKNNKFFIFNDSGIVEELQFKDGNIKVITKGEFKEIKNFFNVHDNNKIKFASMGDRIILYNTEGTVNEKLMFVYNVNSNSGRVIGAESDSENKVYEVFESREMFLIGPKNNLEIKSFLLVDLEENNIVKSHQFNLNEQEELGDVYIIDEDNKTISIMLEILKRKNIEYDENEKNVEEEENNRLIKLYESIDYFKLIL